MMLSLLVVPVSKLKTGDGFCFTYRVGYSVKLFAERVRYIIFFLILLQSILYHYIICNYFWFVQFKFLLEE